MMGQEPNMLSEDELIQLKRHDRTVLTLADFTAGDIAAFEAARAPELSKAFDQECHAAPHTPDP
jgi:hypothetical protein